MLQRLGTASIVLATVISAPAAAAAAQERQPTCVIDMGSNTVRRIVGSFADGRYAQKSIDKVTLGVGDDLLRNGTISDSKLTEIEQTLARFKAWCQRDGIPAVVAIGTAAFRDAPNGGRVVEIAAKLGIRMEIASEQRESELAYLVGSLGRDRHAVVDNGSRSIELVAQENGTLRHTVLTLGYRVAYETFFAAAADAAAAANAFRDRLAREAAPSRFMRGKDTLVGVEFGDMAEVLFASGKVEGRVFTLEQLKARLRSITDGGADEFRALKKTKGIDTALPRLVVAIFVLEEFGYSQLVLTDRELGTGLIIEAGLQR